MHVRIICMLIQKSEKYCKLHFIFRNCSLLVANQESIELPDEECVESCLDQYIAEDWFSEEQNDYTALLLEDNAPTPRGFKWIRLRSLFSKNLRYAGLASRALNLFHFRKTVRYCSFCGGPLQDDKFETAKTCIVCGETYFPKVSPTVIVLVEKNDEILLVRPSQKNTDVYTCIAGYVEAGESLEECVKREVFANVGLSVSEVSYVTSQSWSYPDQVMMAFKAKWESGSISIQTDNIDDAKFFSRLSLPSIPGVGTIAHELIMS